MKCTKCQANNPESNKFCRKCGIRLALLCPSCNTEYIAGDVFCGKCGQKLHEATEPEPEASLCGIEETRKQTTALFSDLVGYTAISSRLDPEDVKELMSRIFGEIAQIVARYEGFIDKFIGDAVLAFWGIPVAHEDDPIRAIRAAKEIHALVEGLSPKLGPKIGQPLVMHSGINTGLVVTGEFGNGKYGHAMTGDSINVASRLSSLAKAGEILVSQETYRLAEGYFTFQDLGPTDIKGKEGPLPVYKVLSARETPLTVHRLSGLRAELIGRKVEIEQLSEAKDRLLGGKSTIFSICGDAGTGKSRLIEEFKGTLDLEKIQWLEGHAYAYCQNIPYSPLVDMMNRVWQIREGDTPDKVREKLESGIVGVIGEREDVIPYIGSLYSLSYPETERIDPELWKNRLHKAVLDILSNLVQRKPTFIFLEDLHWADPSSLELIRYLCAELRYPAIFLCAYRPYFSLFASHQTATLGDSYRDIHIGDLSSSEALDMIGSVLQTRSVPKELRRFVQQYAEGNPFYLEEVVNSLIESQMLMRDNGGWKLSRPLVEYKLSGSISGIISARVDCLEREVKHILQEASVIGRAFFYRILKEVTQLEGQVDRGLSELERLDLVRIRSAQPDLEYIFKHALTQEVVYNGLLKKDREEIHQRIGTIIEKFFADRLPEFYEVLAFHFKHSPSISKAVDYQVKSGEKSFSRHALEEAHQFFKDAFDLLAGKPDRSKQEEGYLIDIIIKWATVFHHRGDAKGLLDLLNGYKELAESQDDKTRLGMFYAWLGQSLFFRQKLGDAYQYLKQALRMGEELQNERITAYARTFLAWVCSYRGPLDEATIHGEKAIEITSRITLTGMDTFLCAHAFAGAAYARFLVGDQKSVTAKGEALLALNQQHPSIESLVAGHFIYGLGFFNYGDFQSSMAMVKQAIQLTQDPLYLGFGRMFIAIVCIYSGQYQEAEDLCRQVIDFSEKFGTEFIGEPARLYLGAALIAQGRMDQGLKMIEAAQRSFLESGNRPLYAMSEYILGDIYLQMVEKAAPVSLATVVRNIGFLARNAPFAEKKAEHHLNKAIEVAKETGAGIAWALACLDLGALHKAKGRADKARECISRVVQFYEQYDDRVWLEKARSMLASLG